jgi:hypothetical protein
MPRIARANTWARMAVVMTLCAAWGLAAQSPVANTQVLWPDGTDEARVDLVLHYYVARRAEAAAAVRQATDAIHRQLGRLPRTPISGPRAPVATPAERTTRGKPPARP